MMTASLNSGSQSITGLNRILFPLNLPYRSQIFLLDGSIWQQPQENDIEIVNDGNFENIVPEIKMEEPDYPILKTISALPRNSAINMETPLPNFSDLILSHINENNLSAVWGLFIEECANYYYQLCPNIQNSSEYQTIGRKMYAHHPAIEYEGKEPWSFFCKSLSQKIRHIKWKIKRRKSGMIRRTTRKPKKIYTAVKLRSIHRNVDRRYVPGKQYKALLRELHQGWPKNTCTDQRIKDILKQTYKTRCYWLASSSSGRLAPLLEEFPCFTIGKYVVHDFLLKLEKEDISELTQRLETLFSAVGSIMVPEVICTENLEMLRILKHIEEQTGFYKGKSSFSKSIVVQKENVSSEEMAQHLVTSEKFPPHLIIFTEGSEMTKAFVVGDQKAIDTQADTFFDALIVLIATYYTFDLEYPRVYSQMLGLLQTYVVGEVYSGVKSNRCTLFIKKLNRKIKLF